MKIQHITEAEVTKADYIAASYKGMSMDEATGYLEKNYGLYEIAIDQYLDGVAIWRGFTGPNGGSEMFLYEPSENMARPASNTMNYINVFQSEDPVWASYPKRNKSLICSSSSGTASGYGYVNVVLPQGDPNIGICPDADFWTSFANLANVFKTRYNSDVSDINYALKASMRSYQTHIANSQQMPPVTNMGELEAMCAAIDTVAANDEIMSKLADHRSYEINMLTDHGSRKTIDAIRAGFSPDINNFKLSKLSTLPMTDDRELWTSAPSLLIAENELLQILKILGK